MTTPDPLELDVRPQLQRGEEPFAAIMSATERLQPGQALRLVAPFRPAPLFAVMANRGFAVSDRRRPDGAWEVQFAPLEGAAPDAGLAPGSAPGAALWPDPSMTLDLAGLAPPEPMVRILEALAALPAGEVLFALLDREPMFLFPELTTRGHEWAGNFAPDGASYRLLVRSGGPDRGVDHG
ncbi:DUF2249 domain-containing protein [Paracoccus benzoatiresistens]|uniref:DUF2249 domain-containing protein n=1 Tax=Paracoccus benzoatiresistens TaxID=2997341 RepID=A0ABT4J957_9RHOB|nr:DUF2249 domain-containing protein [Paracoccus sp. EF6]MCZ0963132.1 DUF2249 domain-containing protein [Paracoccus sp. EF6]